MDLQRPILTQRVTVATPPHKALARWLVATETTAPKEPPTGSVAAARVFAKLSQRVAQLITPVGSEALLKRAVHLARTDVPFLDRVELAPATSSYIDSLGAIAATVEPVQAYDGLVIVLGTLVALLESFIGRDLTFRLLRDVWPELPIDQST